MKLLGPTMLLLLACGVAAKSKCRDFEPLAEADYVRAFQRASLCTMLSADVPNLLELASVPCPDGSGKFCFEGGTKGAEYRRECDVIVVQRGAPPEIVEHESIHHLLDVNGTPVHDHCHPAFVACDPVKPRPAC